MIFREINGLTRARGSLPGFANFMLGQPSQLPEESFAYRDAVRLLPDIYASVTRIQDRIGALPMVFYDGDTRLDRGHPLVDLWASANPRDTGLMLVQQISGSLDMSGNAYLYLDRGKLGGNEINELWCMPSLQMRPVAGPHRMASHYLFTREDGVDERIEVENIIHFRRWDPDQGLVGLSPLSAAMMRASTQRDSSRWVRNIMKNGGLVGGVFRALRTHGDQEIKRIRSQMRERMGGPENAGQAVILPDGLEYVRQALTMSEMQFIELAKLTSDDIYRVYGIPPVVMGRKEGGGLSDAGASTDMLLFYENCIMPRCQMIATTINETLLAEGNAWGRDLRCEFDLSGVPALQQQFLAQAQQLVAVTGGPVMTPQEARDRLGLVDLKDSDLLTLRENLPPEPPPGEKPGDKNKNPKGKSAERSGSRDGTPRSATGADRDAYRRAAKAVMEHLDAKAKRAFTRMFRNQRKRALAAFDGIVGERAQTRLGPINVEELLQSADADIALVTALLKAMVDESGVFSVARAAAELTFDLQTKTAAEFIRTREHLVTTSTLRTTWQALRDKLAAGVAAKESPAQLRARISGVFADRIRSDVAMIARTEVTSAFNFGNYEAATQLGPDHVAEFEWVTANDERVRDGQGTGHDEAEGQRVAIGTPFMVRGRATDPFEPLLFPGDPSGSPGNTINCRCVAMPVPPDGKADAAKGASKRTRYVVSADVIDLLEGRRSSAFVLPDDSADDLLALPSRNGASHG